MKIALTSVADIHNYGDTLFPFMARQEIKKYISDVQFRFFTPTDCIIENEKFYAYSREALLDWAPDAVITIGGEVIHKYDQLVWKDMYNDVSNPPSRVFFDWIELKNIYKAWFSVGALDFDNVDSGITSSELADLDYIGVRDLLSKKKLENKIAIYHNENISIVPDVGWIFPRFFKNPKEYIKKISKLYNIKLKPDNYFVFNINWTSVDANEIEAILNILKDFSKNTGLKIVIINAIKSYKKIDFDINSYLKSSGTGVYLENLSLEEIGSLLVSCRFFVGSSLHCAITSLAAIKPAGLIHQCPLTKFQSLYGHMMMTDLFTTKWDNLPQILAKLYDFNKKRRKALKEYVSFMQTMFDYKLKELIQNIKLFAENKN